MKVSHIFVCLFIISLLSTPVSAELVVESTSVVPISDRDVWSSAISPDGSTIAYVSYDASGRQQIFTINVDGSQRTQVTDDPNKKWGIEWFTDQISYVSYDADSLEKIFMIMPEGTGKRKVMNESIRQGREPEEEQRFWGGASWNPQNRTILFTSLSSVGDEKVFRVKLDGTGRKQIINDTNRQWNPQWAPDGRSFVYISQDNKTIEQLFTARSDGTKKTQITDDVFKKSDLNWGKDGILFVSTESRISTSVKIFFINPDGSGKRRLIENGFNQRNPRWSRDGSTILYEETDFQGNKLIKLMHLKKSESSPTSTAMTPVETMTSTATVTETPLIEKTEPESPPEGTVLSLVLILGAIIVIMLIVLGVSNFWSKK